MALVRMALLEQVFTSFPCFMLHPDLSPGFLLQDLCLGLPHPCPDRPGGAGAGGSARGGRARTGDGGAPRASLHHGLRAGEGGVGGCAI